MGQFEAGANVREPDATRGTGRLPSIIGQSMAMRRLVATVAQVAPKDVTVLVRGETGTGKELIASLVHARSSRSQGPFVRFNCAAIPGELAEAQLFGHVQGAFTGATHALRGFFAQADGGTLVLDEVGELPLAIQAKLLRALQGGEIQPVGAARVERADVRVVACTNRDLAAEVRAGRFREDLYYRLAVLELIVPPLREHREDIPALAAEFARRYGKRFGDEEVRLSPALVEELCRAQWPGNVRQLENAVARMVALRSAAEIDVEAFASAPNFVASAEPGIDPEAAHLAMTRFNASMGKLHNLTGSGLAREFIQAVTSDHQLILDRVNGARKRINDPEVVALIDQTVPVDQRHLTMAQRLQDRIAKQ